MQYSIRNVPNALDRALRKRAKAERKSLNQLALEGLRLAAATKAKSIHAKRDLSFFDMDEDTARSIAQVHEWHERIRDRGAN